MKVEINKDLATLLLTGIETDTSSFQNQSTNKNSLDSAAFLVSRGARLGTIIQNTFEAKKMNLVRIYGVVLERIVYNADYQTVATYLLRSDLEKHGISDDEVSGIANYLNRLKDVKAVFLIVEEPDGGVKVSLRTRDEKVDLSVLAKILGGGGHAKASGFSISAAIEKCREEVCVI